MTLYNGDTLYPDLPGQSWYRRRLMEKYDEFGKALYDIVLHNRALRAMRDLPRPEEWSMQNNTVGRNAEEFRRNNASRIPVLGLSWRKTFWISRDMRNPRFGADNEIIDLIECYQ